MVIRATLVQCLASIAAKTHCSNACLGNLPGRNEKWVMHKELDLSISATRMISAATFGSALQVAVLDDVMITGRASNSWDITENLLWWLVVNAGCVKRSLSRPRHLMTASIGLNPSGL